MIIRSIAVQFVGMESGPAKMPNIVSSTVLQNSARFPGFENKLLAHRNILLLSTLKVTARSVELNVVVIVVAEVDGDDDDKVTNVGNIDKDVSVVIGMIRLVSSTTTELVLVGNVRVIIVVDILVSIDVELVRVSMSIEPVVVNVGSTTKVEETGIMSSSVTTPLTPV